MIKVYFMPSCKDCIYVEPQIKDDPNFEIINIGEHVSNLKKFMALRDGNPVFEQAILKGNIGIPCFEFEDGTVTLSPEDVGLKSRPNGLSCSLDGKGC